MSARRRKVIGNARPVAVGTGLVALDVVYSGDTAEPLGKWAGGTCGNVLAILSCLGWASYPVARLGDNEPARTICRDLARWGVHLKYVTRERLGSTPIIVQRIGRDARGRIVHRFSFCCPGCGRRLPGFRPVPMGGVRVALSGLPTPSVFFFDRVSSGAVAMAEAYRRNGVVVVFEPSALGDPPLFERALAAAHILKVSHERWAGKSDLIPRVTNWLLIETFGAEGLRVLSRLPSYRAGDWEHLPGSEVGACRDTAGAGDWCTAGLIASLARDGAEGLASLRREELHESLRRSQMLAAWNCGFEGARGGLYSEAREDLRTLADGLVADPALLRLVPRWVRRIGDREASPVGEPTAQCLSESCPW